jgi:sugar (pentulose or hexulose) kinase
VTAVRPLLIGVDVGTTRIKAGLVDLDGRELGQASVPTRWHRLATGGEARPEDFLQSARQVLAELLATAPAGEIAGLGVTSMAETAILLDRDGQAVGPSVAWFDRRAADDYALMAAEFSAGETGRRTGLAPGEIPTVATLRWLRRSDPGLSRAVRSLAVAEWVVYGLGGSAAAEPSLASRTGALSITSREWWPDVLRWAGLPATIFPSLQAAGTSWGRVRDPGDGLDRLAGATLTVAGHDHIVASVGSGVTQGHQATDSCGTAEALIRPVPADPARDPGAGIADGVCTSWHVLPGHYCLLVGLRLGIDLIALLDQLGAPATHGRTKLDDVVLGILDGTAPAAPDTAAARRWYAALQAAVDRSGRALRTLEALGGNLTEVRVSGGWAANPVLQRLKARAFPNPVYPEVAEAGIRGAALLAGLAAGVYPSVSAFPPPRLVAGPAGVPPAHTGARQKHQPNIRETDQQDRTATS